MTAWEEEENWRQVCVWMLYESDPLNWFKINDKVWYKEGKAAVWVTHKDEGGRVKVVDKKGRPGNVVAADIEPFIGQTAYCAVDKKESCDI
jgi:hypothetical protein